MQSSPIYPETFLLRERNSFCIMQIFQFHLLALPICRPVAGYFDSDFHTQSMWSLSLNRNLIKVAGSRRQILQAQLSNIGRYMGSVVLFRPAEHFFVQFQSLNAACQPLDLKCCPSLHAPMLSIQISSPNPAPLERNHPHPCPCAMALQSFLILMRSHWLTTCLSWL